MSLNILSDLGIWTEVAYIDHGEGAEGGRYELRPQAYAYVVTGSLLTGLDVLDESTAEEWLLRLRMWEVLDGTLLKGTDDDTGELVEVPVTMDALRPYFGTRTNNFGSRTRTRAKFERHIGDAVRMRAADKLRREAKAAEAVNVGQ